MMEFEPEVLTQRDHSTGEVFVRAGAISALCSGAGDRVTVMVGNKVLELHAGDLGRLKSVLGELGSSSASTEETTGDYVRERGCWGDHRVHQSLG